MAKKSTVYRIFLSAGEPSSDNLAAKLITSLESNKKYSYEFYGIAGRSMEQTGNIKSIFSIQELSVIGYLEVIPKVFRIIFRLIQTVLFIKKLKPHIIITIDSPGFNFLLVKLIRKFGNLNVQIIHYVAPTVWAYKHERAAKCAKLFDHMMVIFPFEKKYFDEVGLKCTYVGNHAINYINNLNDEQKNQIKAKYGIQNKTIITIIPGSRNNELKYHIPVLREFIIKMNNFHGNLCFIIHTLNSTQEKVSQCFTIENVMIIQDDMRKRELGDISDLILCKSGTAVLESVARKIPIVVFYKMNSLTFHLIKKRLYIKYITICNIMMNKEIIPELLQNNFTMENLLRESKKLLYNKEEKNKQLKNLALFLSYFNLNSKNNNSKASKVIIQYLTAIT